MSPNTFILYATLITIDTVFLNEVFDIILSLTASKIFSASFYALFAIFLLILFSFYKRISNFLKNFSKVKLVSFVVSIR